MFEDLIERLRSEDVNTRIEAMEELRTLRIPQVDIDELEELVEASAVVYQDDEDYYEDASNAIMEFVSQYDAIEVIDKIGEVFPKMSSWARSTSLTTLTNFQDEKGIDMLLTLLDKYVDGFLIHEFEINTDPNDANLVNILMPELMEYADYPTLSFSIYRFCLEALKRKTLDSSVIETYLPNLIEEFIEVSEPIAHLEEKGINPDVLWGEYYQSLRGPICLFVDLMGYFNIDEVKECLEKALFFQDNRIKMFAIVSLLRLGYQIGASFISDVAKDAEVRTTFYEILEEIGRENLFPKAYYNQESFAESNLVNWLTFPTELGRTPNDISLAKVVKRDMIVMIDDVGVEKEVSYYVFKFKSTHPDWESQGWMVGVSGYYLNENQPQLYPSGYTFSTFDPFEGKTPEEHVDKIVKIIDGYWNEYNDDIES
jgi:hypothetical protein